MKIKYNFKPKLQHIAYEECKAGVKVVMLSEDNWSKKEGLKIGGIYTLQKNNNYGTLKINGMLYILEQFAKYED